MRIAKLCLILTFLFLALACIRQDEEEGKYLLIEDFQTEISGGAKGTVDFASGKGSSVNVSAASNPRHSGKQSLKVTFNAVSGGYIYVAKGLFLNASNAGWLIPSGAIDWTRYDAIAFYVYGTNSKAYIAFDLKDRDGELWRIKVHDNFKGWKQLICPFVEFLVRKDWQPDYADKNGTLDFPLRSFQFEPLAPSKGTYYLGEVVLVRKEKDD